jgi:hypothetical protein
MYALYVLPRRIELAAMSAVGRADDAACGTNTSPLLPPPQVAHMDQRLEAVGAEGEALAAALDQARADAVAARRAAAAELEGVAALPRERWPPVVARLVAAAEEAVREEAAQKLVRGGGR